MLRAKHVPSFLEKCASKILTSGKYLHVVRECGHNVTFSAGEKFVYSVFEREYHEKVDKAHAFATLRARELLLQEHNLMDRFKSLKRFFLMEQGDVFVHFMDSASEELQKTASEVPKTRMESLFGFALRNSLADKQPDYLSCDMLSYNLSNFLILVNQYAQVQGESLQELKASHLAGLKSKNLLGTFI